ncbi:MAG: hypothetical protein OXI94_06030, partial [Gemmatimonadota bacterium]|nr:hypothetical protein [Gemmatimonadota bacterium]
IMVGLSSGSIAGFFDGFVRELLDSGVTVGSLTVIGMTLLVDLTGSRWRKIQVPMELSSLSKIDEFLVAFAEKYGWTESGQYRLRSVGEEMLVSLIKEDEEASSSTPRRLILSIRRDEGTAEIEFLAASDGENIEDQIAYLGEDAYAEDEHEFSIRLLRHYASSVHHRKYEGIDVITARVENEA